MDLIYHCCPRLKNQNSEGVDTNFNDALGLCSFNNDMFSSGNFDAIKSVMKAQGCV